MGVEGCGGVGVGACAFWGCCLDSVASGVFQLFLVAREMILKPFSPSIVKGMGVTTVHQGALHFFIYLSYLLKGKHPFIPERILEVNHGKHLKEKAVVPFRKKNAGIIFFQ